MNVLSDFLSTFIEPYLTSPLLSSIIGTIVTLLLAYATSVAVYRMLQAIAKRLAPGPVFMFGALTVALVYTVLLIYMVASGRSFEQGVLEWVAGVTDLPLDVLGIYQRPLLFAMFYVLIQGVYLIIVVAVAWAFGLFSKDGEAGGVVREIESELGTSYAMRFYKLCGYHRPDAPEKRFHAWASKLGKVLRWAKWLTLPAVFTGAIPVALWVMGAVIYDGWRRNLTAPPAEPTEEEREEEQAAAAGVAMRNATLLVQALQQDQRGPQLRVLGGGQLQGRPEHAAERTRIADESKLFADVLDALDIEGFYVHQEAAAEAILDGRDVLMETPPLSGRRTLCDILAMRAVLLEGGTALYISPNREESARRAKAFRDVAHTSNWRWAIFHHDLADAGREGLDLKLRQPQIVFTTPELLHEDLCRLHGDWDYFMQSLALVAAIDLDRYTGPRGTNLMYLMRRLTRVAEAAGADPRVLCTVAPFGPDVQGFAERLIGRPLTIVGPESDSRGAPAQYVVVGEPREHKSLHPAVSSRGVAIACGYNAEIWGHGEVLTEFEQEQQVNKVLLEFSRAVVSAGDDSDLRFDDADALVARMSSGKAAMIPFFTRHVGREALGVPSLSAVEVGSRKIADEGEESEIPFAGFERFDESADLGKKGKSVDAAGNEIVDEKPGDDATEAAASDAAADGGATAADATAGPGAGGAAAGGAAAGDAAAAGASADGAAAGGAGTVGAGAGAASAGAAGAGAAGAGAAGAGAGGGQGSVLAQALESAPEVAVAVWLADNDSFSRHLARNPGFVHPQRMHPMMKLGSKLVASPDNAAITVRHLLCAANETPITREEAAQLFSTAALDAVLAAPKDDDQAIIAVPERLVQRPRLRLTPEGTIEHDDELVLEGDLLSRGSTQVASVDTAELVNRSGGEVILQTDRSRILAIAYPGRVLVRGARRYRVLLPDEQQRIDDGVIWAEPERRRITTNRFRVLEVAFEGEGHELKLGGDAPIRFHHEKVQLTEKVLGVRISQPSRAQSDTLHYDEPIVVKYPTRAAIAHLPAGSPEALEAVERLVRVTLPAFVRHAEEDIDVMARITDGGSELIIVDRHPGSTGFARAVTTAVLRHALFWARQLLVECSGPGCEANDGCVDCALGSPRLTPDHGPAVSRTQAIQLLTAILGE